MSSDKKYIRQTILPSLIDTVNYNFSRDQKDLNLFEISSVYFKEEDEYKEEWKLSLVMSGINNRNLWQGNKEKTDFYTIKGIVCNLLDYLGLSGRYEFIKKETDGFHPGICASIMIGRDEIGVIGKIHPNIIKDVYGAELSIDKLMNQKVRGIKFKEISKYPSISKDISILLDKNISSLEVLKVIKKAGGPLLNSVNVFDLYEMDNNKKSLAFNMIFLNQTKTLTDKEVKEIFENIIDKVCETFNAELRK